MRLCLTVFKVTQWLKKQVQLPPEKKADDPTLLLVRSIAGRQTAVDQLLCSPACVFSYEV